MKVLAFDQSTKKTGYALFNGSDLTRWGVIDYHKETDSDARMKLMCEKIREIVQKTKPDVVLIEDISLRKNNVKTLLSLARLQGAILEVCYIYNSELFIYAPTSWRKIIGLTQSNKAGARQDLKEQAIAFVYDKYKIRVGDDCAEAITIGLAHLKETGIIQDLEKIKENNKNGKKD